jgi:hypothetical protein
LDLAQSLEQDAILEVVDPETWPRAAANLRRAQAKSFGISDVSESDEEEVDKNRWEPCELKGW